jgi:hypothetical protein
MITQFFCSIPVLLGAAQHWETRPSNFTEESVMPMWTVAPAPRETTHPLDDVQEEQGRVVDRGANAETEERILERGAQEATTDDDHEG